MGWRTRSNWLALLPVLLLVSARGSAAAPGPRRGIFGVASSAQASGRYAAWMPRMAAAGVQWVRSFPDWNQIEPSRGTWDWSQMDALLEAADRNHLEVSGLFLYNARWLHADNHTFPNDLSAWATYVSNVVRHADGRVRFWEVWNEPENFAAGGTPAQYGRLVATTYEAARAAAPRAEIGLSVASVDIHYLEGALAGGAAGHFDFICVHPYEVLGTVRSGQEALFMSIVPTLRKVLAAKDAAKTGVPIWFTELGAEAKDAAARVRQGEDLIKAYTMGMAEGVSCIDWFEAAEGGYAMGLLDSKGQPTPSYTALSNLTAQLGPTPSCEGWLLLNDRDYAFLFQGPGGRVMVAWAPPHSVDNVGFARPIRVLEPLSGALAATTTLVLSNSPVLVLDPPVSLVPQAQANRTRPFPWNGDFNSATSVSVILGKPSLEYGLHVVESDPGPSTVAEDGLAALDCSRHPAIAFDLDPNFLSYTARPIEISAIVRSLAANEQPGFNLKYEALSGRKGIGWNFVPNDGKWHTLSWRITDDEFVGDWGYHFSFDSDSTNHSRYLLRQVTVRKLGAIPSN
jgi:Glycosyl hydrolase family 10